MSEAKRALRRRVLDTRTTLDARALSRAARDLRDIVLSTPEIASARAVAAYVAVGREPGTGPLIEALSDAGVEVLLPLLQPDGGLDWAPYEGPRALVP
ncbi:MAG TPA: 5-formyltetrahydrofolate cyclo-ligase, partial [Jiangellaceae bacterium]|nr:5-formyltetrahydrofolate cyclo-ligase [Jiangellaceae bacterium]